MKVNNVTTDEGKSLKFAIKITLNEEGSKLLYESIQTHLDRMEDLPKLLKREGIKDNYIKCIEMIDSKHWYGYKH